MRGLKSVTIMDVFDDYALGLPIKEKIYQEYPDAKLAQLKSGGNFPYLSRSDEVNLHLQVNIQCRYYLCIIIISDGLAIAAGTQL